MVRLQMNAAATTTTPTLISQTLPAVTPCAPRLPPFLPSSLSLPAKTLVGAAEAEVVEATSAASVRAQAAAVVGLVRRITLGTSVFSTA